MLMMNRIFLKFVILYDPSIPDADGGVNQDKRFDVALNPSSKNQLDSSELKKIAAEGILTCLQDAIDSLYKGQGMGKIIEEWSFVPRVVEELHMLDTVLQHTTQKLQIMLFQCR